MANEHKAQKLSQIRYERINGRTGKLNGANPLKMHRKKATLYFFSNWW